MHEAREPCLRCGAAMEWRHGTWQCPRCRFKLGCCEGEAPDGCEPPLAPPVARRTLNRTV